MRAMGLSLIATMAVSGCALHAVTSGQVGVSDAGGARNSRPAYVAVAAQFSERDRNLIRNYYRDARKNTAPDLARRERRPPGLVKRRALASGVQTRSLPATLEAQLSALPGGYTRVVVNADVAIIERATRVVIDVVYDVAA